MLTFASFSSFLLSLFLCLFSFITMTTDIRHCCIFSLYDECKSFFPPYFFPALTAKSQKISPVTHSCSYLLSTLSSSSHVASGPKKKCIFECLPMFFFSRIFLCLCSNSYYPYHTHTYTHMHATSSCTITPLHKCNRTPNYGQPLVKLVLLGKNQAAIFNIIMLPNYMVLIGNCLITLSGIWKASV